MLLEEVQGEPLSTRVGQRLELTAFLSLAIFLASTLGEIHRRGVIHKDLKPSNLILTPQGEGSIIDFGSATLQRVEHVDAAVPHFLDGTLAYMSPEQTGRMNRAVDYRTDFYSLGITFYELLTGSLPFQARDVLGWFHAHLASHPPPPHELVASVPRALSAIVMKLLAKAAEERYQGADGLKADLERCRERLPRGERDVFPLGEHDFPHHFQMPQRLYGREAPVATLVESFQRTARGEGPELALTACAERESTHDTDSSQSDALTVVKAQRAISGEIVQERLVTTLMQVAIENAGAQRGALLLARGNTLRVMAISGESPEDPIVLPPEGHRPSCRGRSSPTSNARARTCSEHIRSIVQVQQTYAKTALLIDECELSELVDDAMRIQMPALERHGVTVTRELKDSRKVRVNRHKVLQILINLVSNAKYSMDGMPEGERRMLVRLSIEGNKARIQVVDSGVGIAKDIRERLFSHGFTTRKDGHGFGLHSSALAAQLLGGTLQLESDGPGKGATATLELPLP